MKKLLLGMLAIMTLVMSGCGNPTVAVVVPIEPPSITALRFTQDTATEFINGSVDFFAPDSDVDTITVSVFDSSGAVIFRKETLLNLQDVFDVIRGTAPFSIDYVTFPAGTFTFNIFLTDLDGQKSNVFESTFSIS